jgi:hypothetical protein
MDETGDAEHKCSSLQISFTSKLQKLAFGCVHQIMKSSSLEKLPSFSLVISLGKTNGLE